MRPRSRQLDVGPAVVAGALAAALSVTRGFAGIIVMVIITALAGLYLLRSDARKVTPAASIAARRAAPHLKQAGDTTAHPGCGLRQTP